MWDLEFPRKLRHGLNHRFQKVQRRRLFSFKSLGSAGVHHSRGNRLPVPPSSLGPFLLRGLPLGARAPPDLEPGLVAWFLVLAGDWLSELARRLVLGVEGGGRREFVCESVVQATDESWKAEKVKRPQARDRARESQPGEEERLGPFFSARAPLWLLAVFSFLFSREWECSRRCLGFPQGGQVCLAGRARSRPGECLLLSSTRFAGPSVDWIIRASGIPTCRGRRECEEENLGAGRLQLTSLEQRPVISPGPRVTSGQEGATAGAWSWFVLYSVCGEASPFWDVCSRNWGGGVDWFLSYIWVTRPALSCWFRFRGEIPPNFILRASQKHKMLELEKTLD